MLLKWCTYLNSKVNMLRRKELILELLRWYFKKNQTRCVSRFGSSNRWSLTLIKRRPAVVSPDSARHTNKAELSAPKPAEPHRCVSGKAASSYRNCFHFPVNKIREFVAGVIESLYKDTGCDSVFLWGRVSFSYQPFPGTPWQHHIFLSRPIPAPACLQTGRKIRGYVIGAQSIYCFMVN